MKDVMTLILYFLFVFYDALFDLPYFWVKVGFGIATGLFIPGKIVGLLACAVGNAALFALYLQMRPGDNAATLPHHWVSLIMLCIFAFAGVAWWIVGRVLRRIYFRIKLAAG